MNDNTTDTHRARAPQAYVRGIGSWFPETIWGNDRWPEEFSAAGRSRGDRMLVDIPQGDDQAGRISARYLVEEAHDPFLGARVRHVADNEVTAAHAETQAARAALRDASLDASELDFVLSYSVLIETALPPPCGQVAAELGADRAICWGMDQGCATAVLQLMTAKALIESGQARHVLLTQSHLLLRAFAHMHPASPGLGDAATALVVSADQGYPIIALQATTHAQYHDAIIWRRMSEEDEDAPWWKAGGDFYLGSRKPGAAKQLMRDTVAFGTRTVQELLNHTHSEPSSIGVFASVQPRGWIPKAIAECAGLAPETVSCTYDRYAHLGGCGPIVNWEDAIHRNAGNRNGHVLLYAQGAGFTRAAALLGAERVR